MQNTMVEVDNSSPPPTSASGESNNFLTLDDQMINSDQPAASILPPKKKRNLPGMPDPDSEVIALSPKTLLATNRFVCEICNKGFQRDQNLQLHRRGHNLPWKLKQRSSKEVVRKRVYVCPEVSCVHHEPSRALGDLTGIKKHFCRKHGEKKFLCERCNKRYAVRSDWKAHMKTCGTREYPCDCGTLFSRRDSFITHRAFCDALAQESAQSQPPSGLAGGGGELKVQVVAPVPPVAAVASPPPPPLTPSTSVLSPVLSIQSSEIQNAHLQHPPPPPPPLQGPAALTTSIASTITGTTAPPATVTATATTSTSSTSSGNIPTTSIHLAGVFNSSTSELPQSSQQQPASYPALLCAMSGPSGHPTIDPMSLSLSSPFYGPPSLFSPTSLSRPQPALSATALLQKAAQMGATSSNSSFLRGLGLAPPSSSDPQHNASTSHWNNSVKIENSSLASGLGLGLPSSGSSGLNEFMMGPSTIFGDKPATTLDFLGLGMGGGGSSSEGFSAFLSSISGGLNVANGSFGGVSSGGGTWDDSSDQKPSIL